MSESSIQDSSFAGSPILSYGTTSRKTRYIKITGLLLLIIIGIVSAIIFWFLFLVKIPLPDNMAVSLVIRNTTDIPYNAPLEWRVMYQESQKYPTIVGYTWENQELKPFAVRLTKLSEMTTNRSIWLSSDKKESSNENYGSLVSVFGWPWEWSNKNNILILRPKLLLAGIDNSLPKEIKGEIKDNIWYTDYQIDNRINLNTDNVVTDWSLIPQESKPFVEKYLSSQGVIAPNIYSVLAWDNNEIVDFLALDKQNFIIPLSNKSSIEEDVFTMPDGDTATILYKTASSTSEVNLTTSTVLGDFNKDSIDCPGQKLAEFSKESIFNICSWFDNCTMWFTKFYVNNDQNRMIICFQ